MGFDTGEPIEKVGDLAALLLLGVLEVEAIAELVSPASSSFELEATAELVSPKSFSQTEQAACFCS
jgi:hypothetical protein